MKFLHHSKFATEVIFQKTLNQSTGNSELRFYTEGRKDNSLQFLQNMPHKRAFQFQKHSEAVNELLTLKDVVIIYQYQLTHGKFWQQLLLCRLPYHFIFSTHWTLFRVDVDF